MAGISFLSAVFTVEVRCNAQREQGLGIDVAPLVVASPIRKQQPYTSLRTVSTLGHANEMVVAIVSVSPGAGTTSGTLDLSSMTDVVQQTSVSLSRVKGYVFRLLSAKDDPGLGTACTSVTVDTTVTNGQLLNMPNHTSAQTISAGGVAAYFDETSNGFTVDATHKILKFVNQDAGHTAKVQVTLIGVAS